MIIYWVASEYFWKPKPGAQVQSPANQSAQTQDDPKNRRNRKPSLIKAHKDPGSEPNDNITLKTIYYQPLYKKVI